MKPPAFQFYADDFYAGASEMSAEETGAYIRLLCQQWSKGGLTTVEPRLNRIAGCEVTELVLEKFPICEDGLRRNARLEQERAKQAEYRQKQSEKGKKSAAARAKAKNSNSTTVEPRLNRGCPSVEFRLQPEGNSPSPSPTKDKQTKGRPESMEHVKAYAACAKLDVSQVEPFFDYFTSNGWKVGGRAPMKDWKASFRNWCRNARTQPATKKQNTPANAQNGTVSASMRAVMIKDSLKRCEAAISEIEDKYDYHRDPTQEERQQLKILKTERKQLEQQQRELLAA